VAARRPRHCLPWPRGRRAQTRYGRQRDEVESHRSYASDRRLERAAHAIGQGSDLARAGGIGGLPLVAKAQHPELERDGEVALARVRQDELGRSAADVEESHAASGEIERVAGAEVDEVSFLLAADDANVDTELIANGAREFPSVFELP